LEDERGLRRKVSAKDSGEERRDMETPIRFRNRRGEALFGMVFLPQGRISEKRVGIVMSVNAIKYRIGAFRFHVLLARKLCLLGYCVMYFDPAGIGDSEGDFEYKLLIEHYQDIQTGKYDEDIRDAVDFFIQEYQVETVVLFGLCGGAISMLMAASSDPRIEHLILLGIPVLLEYEGGIVKKADPSAKITSVEKAHSTFAYFLAQIRRPDTWRKLLRLDIDFRENLRLVLRANMVLVRKFFERLVRKVNPEQIDLRKEPVSRHPRFNLQFQRAFLEYVSRKNHILFVFGELDFTTWIFKSEFLDTALRPGNPYVPYYEVHILEKANHIFSSTDSQVLLQKTIIEWLAKQCPGTGRPGDMAT